MMIEKECESVLFSVGTYFAYKIAQRYYNNIHYVWCTSEFDHENQPPTSNPKTICKRYLEQIKTGDRHAKEIERNKIGILKGARIKRKNGIIDEEQEEQIKCLVNSADYEAFYPIIYIINVDRIENKERCKEVPMNDRASDKSVEYIIEDLNENEFKVINLKNLLCDIVKAADRKAGE